VLAVSCVTQLNQALSVGYSRSLTGWSDHVCLRRSLDLLQHDDLNTKTVLRRIKSTWLSMKLWELERSTASTAAAQTRRTEWALLRDTPQTAPENTSFNVSIKSLATEHTKVVISKYYTTILLWVVSIIFKIIYIRCVRHVVIVFRQALKRPTRQWLFSDCCGSSHRYNKYAAGAHVNGTAILRRATFSSFS